MVSTGPMYCIVILLLKNITTLGKMSFEQIVLKAEGVQQFNSIFGIVISKQIYKNGQYSLEIHSL